MQRKWKERYPEKFRCRVVERMNVCDNIVRLARELRINRTLLYKWRYRLEASQTKSEVSIRNSQESTLRREIDKLKRLLVNKTLEVDFFQSALQKVEARRRNSGISGEQASMMPSETPLQGGLSVERMCQLGQVRRREIAGVQRPGCQLERVKLDLGNSLQRHQMLQRAHAQATKMLILTEGVVPYLTVGDVASLADELRVLGRACFWIVDYFPPEAMRLTPRKFVGYAMLEPSAPESLKHRDI